MPVCEYYSTFCKPSAPFVRSSCSRPQSTSGRGPARRRAAPIYAVSTAPFSGGFLSVGIPGHPVPLIQDTDGLKPRFDVLSRSPYQSRYDNSRSHARVVWRNVAPSRSVRPGPWAIQSSPARPGARHTTRLERGSSRPQRQQNQPSRAATAGGNPLGDQSFARSHYGLSLKGRPLHVLQYPRRAQYSPEVGSALAFLARGPFEVGAHAHVHGGPRVRLNSRAATVGGEPSWRPIIAKPLWPPVDGAPPQCGTVCVVHGGVPWRGVSGTSVRSTHEVGAKAGPRRAKGGPFRSVALALGGPTGRPDAARQTAACRAPPPAARPVESSREY